MKTRTNTENTLDRLVYQVRTRAIPTDPKLMRSVLFLPDGSNSGDLKVVARTTPTTPESFGVWESQPLTKREFLRNAAVVGGVTCGLLYFGRQRSEAGLWGFVGAAAFGAAISWVVEKVLDGLYDWAKTYKVGENDLTFTKSPTPHKSDFHNSFAPPYEVSNPKKHFAARRVDDYLEDFGMGEYELDCDLNHIEYLRIRKEYECGIFKSPLLPSTERVPVKEKHLAAVDRIAKKYGIKGGDVTPEYLVGLSDRDGKEHLGVGGKVGEKENLLVL